MVGVLQRKENMARKGKHSPTKTEKHQRHKEWRMAKKNGEPQPQQQASAIKTKNEKRIRHLPLKAFRLSLLPAF
ncbi:MAG: hypothetical protein N2445_06680 [Acidobacteria bacterium]|nr:hypothetical protein [Acidobacteriota bacterium]